MISIRAIFLILGMDILILVDTHEIKPITLLGAGLKELDLTISEGPEQALITDIAHAVESKLGATLL